MFLAGKVSSPVWEFLGWPGQIIPPGTVFTTDMPDSAYPPAGAPSTYRKIDESAGARRRSTSPSSKAPSVIDATAKGTRTRPGWPSFAVFASRYLRDKRPVVAAGQSLTLPDLPATVVGVLQASDADSDALGNWQVTGGSGAYKFRVDRETGAITIPDRLALDVGTTSYDLKVIVSDGSAPSKPQSVTILVPPDVAPPSFTTLVASPTSLGRPNHKMVRDQPDRRGERQPRSLADASAHRVRVQQRAGRRPRAMANRPRLGDHRRPHREAAGGAFRQGLRPRLHDHGREPTGPATSDGARSRSP